MFEHIPLQKAAYHREYRKQYLKNWDQHNSGPVFLDEKLYRFSPKVYLEGVYNHMNLIGTFFRKQFNSDQYRRTSNCQINISSDLTVHATAAATGVEGHITVSTGLFLALEDFWQCIVSDDNTDLHLYVGVPRQFDNSVLRCVETFHDFDRDRFFDYSFLNKFEIPPREFEEAVQSIIAHYDCDRLKANELAQQLYQQNILTPKWFQATSKMVSINPTIVWLGGFLADLSLQWILAHEEAHIYCGHAAVFSEIGVSPSELSKNDLTFLEYARERGHQALLDRFNGVDFSLVRKVSELYADENACMRLVDTYCRVETFDSFPLLHQGILVLKEEYEMHKLAISIQEARFMVILRMCLTAALGSILLFQRRIEKKNLDCTEYPEVSTRISNIIIVIFRRMVARIDNFQDIAEDFQVPAHFAKTMYELGLSTDIKVMTWNLFYHPTLMLDPDFVFKITSLSRHLTPKQDRFTEEHGESPILKLVFESSSYAYKKHRDKSPIALIAGLLSQCKTVYDVEELRSQYYMIFSRVFKDSHYSQFPLLGDSLDDAYLGLQIESKALSSSIKIAKLMREDASIFECSTFEEYLQGMSDEVIKKVMKYVIDFASNFKEDE
jgi:hypothetical protein